MIPKFPQFKKIELSDKEEIEGFIKKYPPYSDFNFTNMWIWNLGDGISLSVLNKNLVVKFIDYKNGQPFLSFLGENMINETAEEMISFSEKNYKDNVLRLVPEIVTSHLDKSKFEIANDLDSHDYVYSILELSEMDSWSHSSLSKGIRQFAKKNPDYIIKQYPLADISKVEYIKMFKTWADNKKVINHFELNEYKAFEKLLDLNDKNIKINSLYVKNILVGFTVMEIGLDGYAISHFAKADTSLHPAVYQVLNWGEAKILEKQGIKYYNWEQDLGIKGLQKSKLKYKPSLFLSKFFVKKLT
jgi:hypothetical protein